MLAMLDGHHALYKVESQGAHGDMSAQSVILQGGIIAREYPCTPLLAQEHCCMPEPDQGSARTTTGVNTHPLSAAVTQYSHTCPRAGN